MRSSTPSSDDRGVVRAAVHAFLTASVRHPELVRLMNYQGLHNTDRLEHIM